MADIRYEYAIAYKNTRYYGSFTGRDEFITEDALITEWEYDFDAYECFGNIIDAVNQLWLTTEHNSRVEEILNEILRVEDAGLDVDKTWVQRALSGLIIYSYEYDNYYNNRRALKSIEHSFMLLRRSITISPYEKV